MFLSCNILETNACQRWEYSAASKLNSVSAVSQGVLQPRVFMQQWCRPFNISLSLYFSTEGQCGCSSYSTLLYALSSAVAVLLLLLLGFVVIQVSRLSNVVGLTLHRVKGKIKFVTMNSTCLLRACHWVPLQLTTKPRWFHNLLLSDVSMFFSKFNWGRYTSMLLFKCSCKKFILVLNHTIFNKC